MLSVGRCGTEKELPTCKCHMPRPTNHESRKTDDFEKRNHITPHSRNCRNHALTMDIELEYGQTCWSPWNITTTAIGHSKLVFKIITEIQMQWQSLFDLHEHIPEIFTGPLNGYENAWPQWTLSINIITSHQHNSLDFSSSEPAAIWQQQRCIDWFRTQDYP